MMRNDKVKDFPGQDVGASDWGGRFRRVLWVLLALGVAAQNKDQIGG
jgi:hypothetical protein